MVGIYFSGTGNTKYAVTRFAKATDANAEVVALETVKGEDIENHEIIVLGYPVQFSTAPKIVREFIETNSEKFNGKRFFIIATMGLASGDGAGCAARLIKKHDGKIVGGLHLKMPDNIADSKLLKKSHEKNQIIIDKATQKIDGAVKRFKDGKPTRDGLSVFRRLCGFLMQRAWFGHKTRYYRKAPKVNTNACIGCGLCVKVCPTKNMCLENNKAVSGDKCTMCYACVSGCPTKALTILGKQVIEQYRMEDYEK